MLQETETFQLLQNLNLTLNLISVTGIGFMAAVVWGYKRRVKERYDDINKRLDHILLLAHETYQTEVDRKREDLEDQKDPLPNTRTAGKTYSSRSQL